MEFLLRQFKTKTESESFMGKLNSFETLREITYSVSIYQIFEPYLATIEYENCCAKRM